MKDILTIKKENVIKAMKEGCIETQTTLNLLFPDIFKEEKDEYYTILPPKKSNACLNYLYFSSQHLPLLQRGSAAAPKHLSDNGKSIYLKELPGYQWNIIIGNNGYDKLLVLKKI